MKQKISEYAHGKLWYWYVPALLATIGFFILAATYSIGDRQPNFLLLPFNLLDFGLHELAHVFASGLPDIFTAAAGSFTEILWASLLVGVAVYYRAYFAAAFLCSWVTLAFKSAGGYMSDARAQQLPLMSIGGGENVTHDWNFVFGKLGLLEQDKMIGGLFIFIGVIIGLAGVLFGVYLVYQIASISDKSPTKNEQGMVDSTHYPTPKPKGLSQDEITVTDKPVTPSQLYPTASHGRLATDESKDSDQEKSS